MHPVAVIFDFMEPLIAVRRGVDQLGELRRDPFGQRGRGNRGAAGSHLTQDYEMLAERARGSLSGEVLRPDEHETRRHTIYWLQ